MGNKTGKLVLFSGPSGVGKDSVLDIGTSFGAGARGSALTVGKEKYGTVHMLEDACLEDVLINSGYIGLYSYDTVIKNAEILSGCYMDLSAGHGSFRCCGFLAAVSAGREHHAGKRHHDSDSP